MTPRAVQPSQVEPLPSLPKLNARKRVLLVVTGGIAAYKCCQLVRGIRRWGAEVQVVMTAAATKFVTPLTFATLSGRPALTDLFPEPPPVEPIHLAAAHNAAIMVVAPASADFIGKMALGLADDLASSIALGFQCAILVAPAMNTGMWENPAVQRNIAALRERGVHLVGPEAGEMAGVNEEPGMGRMSEPDAILSKIEELLADRRWAGLRVLVTSGPTREPLDPVRFISNHSSGRMGDAVARQAYLRGAEVVLVRGKGASGTPPSGVSTILVDSAAEMAEAVKAEFKRCRLLVMAAAVADWRPARIAASKLKKNHGLPEVVWEETEDILSWAGKSKQKQVVVGFALETARRRENARRKLTAKRADFIALNDPTQSDSAFGGETIRLTIISRSRKPIELPVLPKRVAADRLLDAVEPLLLLR